MLNPSLLLLERQVAGLHIGGKSALAWYGITHYVSQHSTLHLYGWAAARLPDWFLERFPAEYHRKRLFELGGTLKAAGHGLMSDVVDPVPIARDPFL